MAAPPQAPDFVQLFVAVGDVKSSVAHAVPPTLLPEGDEMVVMHDPSGMSFAVWRRD
ncbi:MAG: hypothetical protein ABI822_12730 [Bryobacteraceae bacterium]